MADEGIKVAVSLVPDKDSTKKAGEQLGKQLSDTLKNATKIDLSDSIRRSAITAKKEFARFNDIKDKIANLSGTSEIRPEQASAYKTALSNVAKYSKELDKLTQSQNKAEASYQKLAKTLDDKAEARKQKEIERLDKEYETAGRIASKYDAQRNKLISEYKGKHGISDDDVAVRRLTETSDAYNKAIAEHKRYSDRMAEIEQKRSQVDKQTSAEFKTDAEIAKLKEAEQAYKNYGNRIQEITEKISANREVLKDATFVKYEDTKEAVTDLQNLEDAANKLKLAYAKLQGELLKPTIQQNAEIFKTISNSVKEATGSIAKMSGQLMKLAGSTIKNNILKLSSSVRGLGTDSQFTDKSFKKAIKTFIKYGFGVRSFFYLFRKIRSAIVGVFTELGKENFGEVGKSVNALADSLNYLKNSWVAAFAPILNFVTPALSALMDNLAGAVNMLAAFFSMLTGKQIYMKAIKQTGTLAKETKKGAGAQKEWNNELYDFDELNRQKDDNSGGGGGASPDFEEVPIGAELSDWIKEWIKRLKDAWNDKEFYRIGQLLAQGLSHALNILDDWINNVFRPWGVKWAKNLADIVNGFFESWNLWDIMGKTISDGIAAVLDIASTFLENVNFDSIGKAFGILLNRIFANDDMWNQVARFVSARINALFDFLKGFLDETLTKAGSWGNTIWQTIVQIVNSIHWDTIVDVIVNGVQWVINFLNGFLYDTATWQEVSNTISSAINAVIAQVNLDDLGKSINELITRITEFLRSIDWNKLGYKIGQFLGEIDWLNILSTVGIIIVETLWGAINGFLSTSQGQATLAVSTLVGLLLTALKVGFDLLKLTVTQHVQASLITPILEGAPLLETILSALSTAFTSLTTAIGNIAGPVAIVIALVASLTSSYGGLEGVMQKINSVFESVTASVSAFAKKIGFSEMIDRLKVSFNNLTQTITKVYKALGILKPLWDLFFSTMEFIVTGAINMIIGALSGLGIAVSGVIDIISGVVRVVIDLFTGPKGWGRLQSDLELIAKGCVSVFEGFFKTIYNIISGLVTAVIKFFKDLKYQLIGDPIVVDMWEGIKKIFTDAINNVIRSVSEFVKNVITKFTEFLNNAKSSFTTTWNNIKNTVVGAFNSIKSTASSALNAVSRTVTNIFNSVLTKITTTCSSIYTNISNAWNSVSTITQTAWGSLKTTVYSIWTGLRTTIASVDFTSIGSGMVNGIKSGINEVWSSLKESFMEKVRSLIDKAKSLLQIHSPSKVFEDIGKNTALGLAEGIMGEDAPLDATESMIKELTDVDTNMSNLPTSLDSVIDRLSIIADKFAYINESLAKMANLNIPAVARGGVAPSGALSQDMRNDNSSIVRAIQSMFNASPLNNQSGTSQGQPIKIYINGRELFDVVVDENNSAIMRTGSSPLML